MSKYILLLFVFLYSSIFVMTISCIFILYNLLISPTLTVIFLYYFVFNYEMYLYIYV